MHELQENRLWNSHQDFFSGERAYPVMGHWRDFVEAWRRSGKSVSTVCNVASSMYRICRGAGLVEVRDWQNSGKVFESLHSLAEASGWSNCTFNSHRKNAGTYFAFLKRRAILQANPVHGIEKMREKQKSYKLPTPDDFAKIIGYLRRRPCINLLERKRNVLFFLFLQETAARPQELLSLKLENVVDRKSVRIDGIKLGGKPRSFPLSALVRESLCDYIAQAAMCGRSEELADHLFTGKRTGSPWSYSGVRKLLERINRDSGTAVPVTCYSYRRNAATSLYRRRLPLERISKVLGHSRLATTMRYIQDMPEINAEAVGLLGQEYGSYGAVPAGA